MNRGTELVAVVNVFSGRINDAADVTYAQSIPSSGEAEVLQVCFELLSDWTDLRPSFRVGVRHQARLIYASLALCQVDPSATFRILDRLAGGGLLAALHGDRMLLRTLARVSLQNSVGYYTVESISLNLGITQNDLLERLRAINESATRTLETELIDGLPRMVVALV